MSTGWLKTAPWSDQLDEIDRRERILVAARAEFARRGWAGARVQRIADRAQVNKQLVFYYFGSKAGLYRAVLEQAMGESRRDASSVDDAAHAHKQLRDEMSWIMGFLIKNGHLQRLLLADVQESEPSAELAQTVIDVLSQRLAAIVSRGQGRGYFREDQDPDRVAHHALALILGHLALWRVTDPAEVGVRTDKAQAVSGLVLRSLEW